MTSVSLRLRWRTSIFNLEGGKSLRKVILEEANTAPPALALTPYPFPAYTLTTALKQYLIVLLAQLSSYRGDWVFQVFISLVVPVALVFSAKSLIGTVDAGRAIFLLGGNMAMSIAFGPTTFLITKMGWSRQSREFDYWISSPVPKLVVVLAIISMALLFALPGLAGSYLFGSLLLGLPLTSSWGLIALIPLGVLPLAGVGAFLGTIAPNGQTAGLICNILLIVVGFLSPMFIEPSQLPKALQITSLFVPTTYVADAFRSVMSAHYGPHFVFDIAVLTLCSVLCLAFAQWKMEWRIV
jgi:ABC-2 type transport system permease protein